jgi:prephenate dehydrogenase
MGGSLGLRLRSLPDPPRVTAFGRTEATLKRAKERGAIDAWSLDPAEAVRGADLVVLCAPVRSIPDQITQIAPGLSADTIVTDVGSTKVWITAEADRRLPPGVRFVGSHPMAGSERAGIESADPALYEQAVVIVTPSPRSDEESLRVVHDLWRSVGSLTITLPTEAHDRIVASVSHLPHVVAALLVNTVAGRAKRDPRTWDVAAGGFRDTTRIASSLPDLWRDICLTNRAAILEAVDGLESELRGFREVLAADDGDGLQTFFAAARSSRDAVPPKGGGLLPSIIDLFVEVADRPGVIAEVSGILGRAGINIVDIEIAHVRESEAAAPLRVFFDSEAERARASEELAAAGYKVQSA